MVQFDEFTYSFSSANYLSNNMVYLVLNFHDSAANYYIIFYLTKSVLQLTS